jgi:small-conductance mechanosensitive channel
VSTAPAPRTAAALAARHRTTESAIQRVHDAITRLRREKAHPSVAAVARRAGVSRSFVYGNAEARSAVAAALAEAGERRVQLLDGQDSEREATWRERALNAEDAIKAAHAEIGTQRTRIGELLGQVRDLEAEWTQEAIMRITTENTTLKQRVRQLTTDSCTLEERLQAARSNNRFADRRIAQLEAELAAPPGTQQATLCAPSPWTPQEPSRPLRRSSSSAAGQEATEYS